MGLERKALCHLFEPMVEEIIKFILLQSVKGCTVCSRTRMCVQIEIGDSEVAFIIMA